MLSQGEMYEFFLIEPILFNMGAYTAAVSRAATNKTRASCVTLCLPGIPTSFFSTTIFPTTFRLADISFPPPLLHWAQQHMKDDGGGGGRQL